MKKNFFNWMSILMVSFVLGMTSISCDKDDSFNKKTTEDNTNNQSITKPEVKITSHYANGTYDGWYVIGTVTTGGDDPNNVSCILEWAKFAKKKTGTVKLTNQSDMIGVNYSSKRVQFKKEHAGINKGTYIYYRLVGSNSKYSSSTSTTYMVAQ